MTADKQGRLLFLAPIMPSDSGNGLAMRVGFFLDAYARCFDVDLAVVPVAGGDLNFTPFVSNRVNRAEILSPGFDSHHSLVLAVNDPEARLAAFRRYGRPSLSSRAATTRRALEVWTLGARYRAIHVSRLYLAELVTAWLPPADPRPLLLIDCDEDDAAAYRRLARLERGRARDAAARWMEAEAEAFARQAGQWLPRFDARFAASLNEANSLSARFGGVAVIPNVTPIGAGRARARRATGRWTIVFVGSLGYEPNADGVLWFVARVWPRLRWALSQRVRFVVVGSNPPTTIAALDGRNGVVVTGAVEHVAPFYALADLAVIPVRGGGGARIKLIEAASFAVPIVSTRFGAQGTSFRHGSELLLADDATSFLMGCLALLTDRARAARLASHARQRTRRAYGEERWRLHMEHFLSSLLMRSSQGQLSEPRA